MINKGTSIHIKYKNFSDKDLVYITRLVNKEFNEELEKLVGKPAKGSLRAPLELKEVHTGNSILIDYIPNLDLIMTYLVMRMGETVLRNVEGIVDEELQQMLKDAIRRASMKFRRRRREDDLKDFSYGDQ